MRRSISKQTSIKWRWRFRSEVQMSYEGFLIRPRINLPPSSPCNHSLTRWFTKRISDIIFTTCSRNYSYIPRNKRYNFWVFRLSNMLRIPFWYRLVCETVIVRPSSATVGRIFSLYDNQFSQLQQSALEYYRKTSIILRFNENQRESNK